jgi:hypothetical protein
VLELKRVAHVTEPLEGSVQLTHSLPTAAVTLKGHAEVTVSA